MPVLHTLARTRMRLLLALLMLGLAGVAARLTRINHSFWNDESFNVFVSSAGPMNAIDRISGDIFPPLYNVLLSFWLPLVPNDELAIRALSMLAGMWVIAIAFLLTLRWFGFAAGVLAGLLTALSPAQALWSQVARPLALDTALAMAVVYLSDALVRSSATAREPHAGCVLLLALVAAATAALYTSHGAVILVSAAAVPLFWQFFVQRHATVLQRIKIAGTFVLIVLLWLPLVPYALRQRANPQLLTAPQHHPDFARVLGAIAEHAGVGHLWTLSPLGTVLIASTALVGVIHLYRRNFRDFVTLISFTAVPILLCVLLWLAVDDIFGRVLERAFWLNVVLLCAAAGGFVHLGWLGRSGAGLAVALSIWGLANLMRSPPPDWSSAAQQLARVAAPGDAVMAVPQELYYSARYYVLGARPDLELQRYGRSGQERPLPLPASEGVPIWLIVDTRERPEQVFGGTRPAWVARSADGRLLMARFDEPPLPPGRDG